MSDLKAYRVGVLLWGAPLSWCLGVAALLTLPRLWPVADTSLWVFLCLLGLVFSTPLARRQHMGIAWVLAAVVCTAFISTGWRGAVRNAAQIPSALEGRDIAVQGYVASLPANSAYATRFDFDVTHRQSEDGQWVAWPRRLQLQRYYPRTRGASHASNAPVDAIEPGARWQWPVRLKAVHALRNPHGFDSRLKAWSRGVYARGYVRPAGVTPIRMLAAPTVWHYGLLHMRGQVRARIQTALSGQPRVAALVAALVLGDQQGISSPDWTLFRDTGVAHLVSISGLHIGLFAWLAYGFIFAGWRLGVRAGWRCFAACDAPAWAAGGAVAFAVAYALFSGWGLPAQRTVLMLLCFLGVRRMGWHWPWWVVWLWAMALVLLFDPWAMVQAGFWLSFVAVAVLFALPKGVGGLSARTDLSGAQPDSPTVAYSGLLRRAWDGLCGMVRTQWHLSLVLAPLTWLFFGQVSLVALAVNLIAIPLVSFVFLPLALLGNALPVAWSVLSPLALWGLQGLTWAHALPFGVWHPTAAPGWLALAVGAAFIISIFLRTWRMRVLVCAVLLPALLYQPSRPPQDAFDLLAFDVGQGSAVLIRTAHHALLFDAGPRYASGYDVGARVVLAHLLATGQRVDRLVLSHADSDHVGGARALLASPLLSETAVLASFPRAQLPFQSRPKSGANAKAVAQVPAQAQTPAQDWTPCEAGVHWLWDGVLFDIVQPQQGVLTHADGSQWLPDKPRRRNALSCVLRIRVGAHTAWLTGDMGLREEVAVIRGMARAAQPTALGERAGVTVVLAGHHGSHSSNGQAWLEALRPRFVIAQAGYRNQYGHPAATVRARWDAATPRWGLRWVDSARCGAAYWRSDAPTQLRCERVVARRQWQQP